MANTCFQSLHSISSILFPLRLEVPVNFQQNNLGLLINESTKINHADEKATMESGNTSKIG